VLALSRRRRTVGALLFPPVVVLLFLLALTVAANEVANFIEFRLQVFVFRFEFLDTFK